MGYRILSALVIACAASFPAIAQPNLAAATLPNARSVLANETATVFATVLNSGTSNATNCRVELDAESAPFASVNWQRTDATNTATGTPNEPFAVPAGSSQTLVIALTPNQPTAGRHIGVRYICQETEAPMILGTNDVFLRASSPGAVVADVIMVLQTLSGDGVIRISENGRRGVAAGSLVNIGDSADIQVTGVFPVGDFFGQDGPQRGLASGIELCQTNGAGQCLEAPASAIILNALGNTPVTFNVYINDDVTGGIPFLPEFLRLAVVANQQGTATGSSPSGATSTAVHDAGPTPPDTFARGRWWGYHGAASEVLENSFYLVLAPSGEFVLGTSPQRYSATPAQFNDVYFGTVSLSRDGTDTVLSGMLESTIAGTPGEPVSVDGLRMTPNGILRGNPGMFSGDRTRGYFVAEPPDIALSFITRVNSVDRASYSIQSHLSGEHFAWAQLVPDSDQPGRFTSSGWSTQQDLSGTCQAELVLQHRSGTPAPQTYDVQLTLGNCGADATVNAAGVYSGWGIAHIWRGPVISGGGDTACLFHVFTQNAAGRRQNFTLSARAPFEFYDYCNTLF